MSRVTRQKHYMYEMMNDDYELPKENQQIVRIVCSKGNNLHEAEPAHDAENFLISMPNKFRNNIWIKRGDFVVIEPIQEGDKVKGEIVKILTATHIKEYSKSGIWPKKFTKKREHSEENYSDGSDDERFVVKNKNRPPIDEGSDSSSCDNA
ncbi:probable RNA-binding protein EIF1AD [Condylostylus longicornis]|uniref:probable RNA-binding protein EIF1AD n=1 Tax=Condylostylus longicornis TaxID=2530218 RepID=UPI00244DF9CD|nr:probable RNA-binding protein EIF1AD [Condylostylus longicornis]